MRSERKTAVRQGPCARCALACAFATIALAGGACTTNFDSAQDTGHDTGAGDGTSADGTTPDLPDADATDTADGHDATDAPDSSDPVADTAVDTHADLPDATDVPWDDAPAPCTHNGFVATSIGASRSGTEVLFLQARSSESTPFDILSIELYYGYGEPPPLDAPGEYVLATTAAERNYATCGTCVVARTGYDGTVWDKVFLATGGVLEINAIGAVGTQFTGSLSGVTMEEVTIDTSTYISTPVPGGEGWCIEAFEFDTAITGG